MTWSAADPRVDAFRRPHGRRIHIVWVHTSCSKSDCTKEVARGSALRSAGMDDLPGRLHASATRLLSRSPGCLRPRIHSPCAGPRGEPRQNLLGRMCGSAGRGAHLAGGSRLFFGRVEGRSHLARGRLEIWARRRPHFCLIWTIRKPPWALTGPWVSDCREATEQSACRRV
jgi:hypothetical protein